MQFRLTRPNQTINCVLKYFWYIHDTYIRGQSNCVFEYLNEKDYEY